MATTKLLVPICMFSFIFFIFCPSLSSSCGVSPSNITSGVAHNTSLIPGFTFPMPSDNKFSPSGPVLLTSPNSTFLLSLSSCQLLILHNDNGVFDTPIWDATFPNCSSSSTHTLTLQNDGNFVVSTTSPTSSSPTIVWSSGTSGHDVQSVQLSDSGNLVLLDASSSPLWQSFDHPSSYLLSGQRLQQGMSLFLADDSVSHVNYSLVIEPDRAVMYASDHDGEPKPYYQLRPSSNSSNANISVAYAALDGGNLQLFDSSNNPLVDYQTSNHSYGLWRAQLTPTQIGPGGARHGGNLEIYFWSVNDGSWHLYSQAITNLCDFPDACPHYSTCDPATQQCSCESPLVSSRCGCDLPIPSSQGRQVEPNFCSSSRLPKKLRFSELGNTSYFPLKHGASGYNVTYIECKSYCLQNCSCAAFVYQGDQNSCYPIHESDSSASMLTFLRVDDSKTSVYIRTSSGISTLTGITVTGLILSFMISSIFNLL